MECRHARLIFCALGIACVLAGIPTLLVGHVFVPAHRRVGAYPTYDGNGWIAEAFLDIPSFNLAHYANLQRCMEGPDHPRTPDCDVGDIDGDGDVDLRDVARFQKSYLEASLLSAERLIADREPDFTFKTRWIDFPAGPTDSKLDSDFATVGDFLDDYIYDVSDASKLDEPFGSLLLRFTGFITIKLENETRIRDFIALPVWVDVGTMGFDGYRTRIGETVYRIPNVKWAAPFYFWGPAIEALGLYPIEITYVNVFDPENIAGNNRAGLEIYSWHGGGFPWPAGQNMPHERYGVATLLPPRIIYQAEDILPLVHGDFDADFDIDLEDFQWYQNCGNPSFFFLPSGCDAMDFNEDDKIREDDFRAFRDAIKGPGRAPEIGDTP